MSMKVIILAAGRGSRMNDGTAEMPKCMMRLFGMTLIDHCIRSLELAGFSRSDIGIVTGYRSDKIEIEGVQYFHNRDWGSTNMFVSLTVAREWICKQPCIVCYSDIVFHPSAVRKLVECGHDIAITYYTGSWELWKRRFKDPLTDLESFKMVDGKLTEIGGRPRAKRDVQGQYMGLLRFTPIGWKNVERAVIKPMPQILNYLDMTTLLQHMLDLGYEVGAIPTDELWLECDSQSDIQLYENEFAGFSREIWG